MKPRERVIKTLCFSATDRPPCDLMEGEIWPELQDFFRTQYGFQNKEQIFNFLGTDFRWIKTKYTGPRDRLIWPNPRTARGWMDLTDTEAQELFQKHGFPSELLKDKSKEVMNGPLASANTIAEVESFAWPDPQWWQPGDFSAFRQQWPDHALVFHPRWMPLFWCACEAFGMEEALIKMATQPHVFEAFVHLQHEFYMNILSRGLKVARGFCDICWLGDDYASQQSMLMNPDLWRKLIKPYLARQVQLVREHDMYVLFHSCGAVRPILPDLMDIGVNALLVFQTTASGMEVESIAREFGGRLAFYGGMDIQQLLSYGSAAEVQKQAQKNIAAFASCGGYMVANCHSNSPTIRGENIIAMCEATRNTCQNSRKIVEKTKRNVT